MIFCKRHERKDKDQHTLFKKIIHINYSMLDENMSANGNVSDEKKTWWQIHRLKILIAVLLVIIVVLVLILLTIKTRTIPSKKSS